MLFGNTINRFPSSLDGRLQDDFQSVTTAVYLNAELVTTAFYTALCVYFVHLFVSTFLSAPLSLSLLPPPLLSDSLVS